MIITTHERIEDPAGFMLANPDLANKLAPGDFTVVSGPDLVVGIERPEPYEPEVNGSVAQQESALFGDLYRSGQIDNCTPQGSRYSASWYPSPTAANELGEQLGLRPGENMLRFTHAEHASVPPAAYLGFIARGEFPQATATAPYFRHDRSNDHAIGVLLMPPQLTTQLIPYVRNLQESRRRHDKIKSTVLNIDAFTSSVGRISEAYTKAAYQHEPVSPESLRFGLGYLVYTMQPYGYLHNVRHHKQNRQHAAQLILEHITELAPRIEALKKQQKTAPAAVFKG